MSIQGLCHNMSEPIVESTPLLSDYFFSTDNRVGCCRGMQGLTAKGYKFAT